MICWRAPGKTILFGEHFVVKGKPALTIAVSLYARVIIEPGAEGHVIYSPGLNIRANLDSDNIPCQLRPFHEIYSLVSEKAGSIKPFKATIVSEIPIGAGMGSSAATAVSFTAALLDYAGLDVEAETVRNISFEAEKITHGKPSGIDNTISTYGGMILYEKGRVEKLQLTLPRGTVIVAVDTGKPRSTAALVRNVLQLYDKYPVIFKQIYSAAEQLVYEAISSLRHNDPVRVGELMNINQGLLAAIGVSSQEIEAIRYRMMENGAYGSKLTGAGGGGIVIGLTDTESSNRIANLFEAEGFKTYVLKQSSVGVSPCQKPG